MRAGAVDAVAGEKIDIVASTAGVPAKSYLASETFPLMTKNLDHSGQVGANLRVDLRSKEGLLPMLAGIGISPASVEIDQDPIANRNAERDDEAARFHATGSKADSTANDQSDTKAGIRGPQVHLDGRADGRLVCSVPEMLDGSTDLDIGQSERCACRRRVEQAATLPIVRDPGFEVTDARRLGIGAIDHMRSAIGSCRWRDEQQDGN
ncbi:hypothetical protein APZ00_17040 [Pannonibacter phragmitetus]|uniref:Uncharacterized protein n=1 Tax=Pannonibacter phragmitetus TaxID=121719 RepID=A0A0U3PLZ0_9HYPH|nr:hypothetical protein APZ00_17040 [Pannonibacter phragmitetus]